MWNGLIGVDIGGTHIGIGLINSDSFSVENSVHIPINGIEIGTGELVQLIVDKVQSLLKSRPCKLSDIKAIGIGCPGQVVNNVLIAASNFPKMVNAPIASMVSRSLSGTFTYLLNDADAAASAEVWGNASCYAKYSNIAMITLGTGIGFSLILNGSLYQGSHGIIEGGHMIVDSGRNARKCPCGQSGCCEAYASARTTVERLQELDASDTTSKRTVAKSSSSAASNAVDGKVVFDRYHLNDFNAVRCVEETAENLAVLCINICRVIDPEVIIFGGGLSKAGPPLLDLIKKYVSQRTWTVLPTDVKLMLAVAEDNGILGAALAARNAASNGSSSDSSKNHQPEAVPVPQPREKEMALIFVTTSTVLLAVGALQYKSNQRKDNTSEGSVLNWLGVSLLIGQLAYGIYRIIQ